MTFDELSRTYDGIISHQDKLIHSAGGYEAYYRNFLERAERNFAARCALALQSIIAWRVTKRYESAIVEIMQDRLRVILNQSRGSAIKALGLSKVAVSAAPINTA